MARKISILIVDDEESVRDSLYNWFIDDGYVVECAENAKKALSMLEARDFDIILADIKMPGMDGIELARAIREGGHEVPILLLSSNSTFAEMEEGRA